MGFTGAALLAGLVCIASASPAIKLPTFPYFSSDGVSRTVQTSVSAVQDVHGVPHAVHGSISDLHDTVRSISSLTSDLSDQLHASVSKISSDLSDRVRTELAVAQQEVQQSVQEAQAAIEGLAIFASKSPSISSTSYTLKNSHVTISRNVFGVSPLKPPIITVTDASSRGLVCVPRGSISAVGTGAGGGTVVGSGVTTSSEEAAGGGEVAGGEYSGKIISEEVHKSVAPTETIGQGQGIVVTVDVASSTSAAAGHGRATASVEHGATASAGYGATVSAGHESTTSSVGHGVIASAGHGATASTGHGVATSAGHGEATASAGHGATVSAGHGATVSAGHEATASSAHETSVSTGHESSASSGHEESSFGYGEEHTEQREHSVISSDLDVTTSGGPEASAIETFPDGVYTDTHEAVLVSTDGSHADTEHAQSGSGLGASATAGSGHGASATAGTASATAGHGVSTTSSASHTASAAAGGGHFAAGSGHGASATAGTASATAGHGVSTTSSASHTASATAGGGRASASSGVHLSSTAGGSVATASSGLGVSSTAGGSRTTATAGHRTVSTSSSSHSTSATSSGGQGFSATISGGKLFTSDHAASGGRAHVVTTDGSAAAAGGGYTQAVSSGSGSSSASSVDSEGRVSVDVSGPAAEAAAIGAGGQGFHLSSTGGLTHIDETDCECVPDYLCDEDGYINTSGAGFIDVRSFSAGGAVARASRCGVGKVCCRHREEREPVGWFPSSCGTRSPVRLDRRVVTGEAARLGQYPWTVALMSVIPATAYTPERQQYLCAGSLVREDVVLTGAHCVKSHQNERLVARVGEWDTSGPDPVYPHQELPVAEVVIHEQFDEGALWYDVALLRLERPAELSAHINTICLPTEDDYYIDYSDCYAAGWGQESFDRAVYSSLLKHVPLSKVDSGQCQSRMRETRLGRWFQLHDTFLCAGGLPGVDTCRGDGGGALVCRDTSHADEETFVQIGIVAWGIKCHRGGFPGVYADVIKLLPWIREKLPHLSGEGNGY